VNLTEIQIAKEKSDALDALYRRMDANPWPKYDDNPKRFMELAREFLDAAKAIYPNA
jgi:hypothetical protein